MPRVRLAIAALLTLAVAVTGAIAPIALAAPAPKVVLVVGPVGATTDRYRQLADEAAAEARRFTPNVVRVYSPNATWPRVKRALQGASIVVYLGHGNGWPSPYRNALYPPTQNGFGLNPVAGGDDSTHQYFGEASIAASVRLAPGAVVLLHHLCYASGNSEPGLPEGGEDLARQRVDNFAAGFLGAGAGAVIAEAHDGPAFFVRELLTARGTVEAMWRSAPTFNDHVIRFSSSRSPGHVAMIDPDRAHSGFTRSIVLRPGLRVADVRGGRPGALGSELPSVLPHTLLNLGLEMDAPALVDLPVAGRRTALAIGYRTDGSPLPEGLRIAYRWDPLELTEGPSSPSPTPAGAADTPSASPAPSATPEETSPAPGEVAVSSASPPPQAPAPSPVAEPPPGPRLVVAESPGSVVAPIAARIGESAIALPVRLPRAAGLYRLVTTFHDAEGVAYDAETQALVPALIVRVAAPLDAHFAVNPTATVERGRHLRLPLRVTNVGAERWGSLEVPEAPARVDDALQGGVRLAARWVPLEMTAVPGNASAVWLPLGSTLAPGASATLTATLKAPSVAGDYLLILDVVLPGGRSLTADGVAPGLVRVVVE